MAQDDYQVVAWSGNNSSYSTSYYDSYDKNRKFRGLANQGATCYMNSLLQSLFMTPEFRQRIYKWEYDPEKHGDSNESIPFQLQFLFSKLQLSSSYYCETTKLTKSFGWDLRESFQQHDVQEFCRVLFDAIEQSVEDTPQQSMINELYEGTMIDYVECLNCHNESRREDKFLDISLTVKNVFDNIYNDSVEKALENYIKGDELTGDNQYFCSNCDGKQDAMKGLKFKTLPYVLVLQLKRFDLDYNTFQRIKLDDEVRFPQILNMNPFVRDDATSLSRQGTLARQISKPPVDEEEQAEPDEWEDIPMKITPDDIDQRTMQRKTNTDIETLISDREKFTLQMDPVAKKAHLEREKEERLRRHRKQIDEYLEDGEYVYELFSAMIHSGGAMGGHYYAYIKSFDDCRWYNFNDSTVKEIQEKDLEKVYGGKTQSRPGAYSYNTGYSANAYLLMYRKVRPDNLNLVPDEEVPAYIQKELEQEAENEKLMNEARAENQKSVQVRMYYKGKEMTIWSKKDDTVGQLKEKGLEAFEIKDVKDENCRLRSYSIYNDTMQDAYDDKLTLGAQNIWSYKPLAIEIKEDDEEFAVYDPNMMPLKILQWNDEYEESNTSLTEKCQEATRIQVDKRSTVRELMKMISTQTKIPENKLKILKKSYMGTSSYAETISSRAYLDYNMNQARVYEGSILLIEEMENTMLKGKWQTEIEREANRYTVKFNHPDDKPNFSGYSEFKHSVLIDSKALVSELKELIAKKLDLPADEFLLKRGSKNAMELKDLKQRLTQANIMNGSVLFIERGKPTSPDEFRILFYLTAPPRETDYDNICFRYFELFQLPVNANLLVSELKEILVKQITERYPSIDITADRMRLRERQSERLSRVLMCDRNLRQYSMFENKNIAIQIIDEPNDGEQTESGSIIIVVRRWWPSTWELSAPQEFSINKFWNLGQLGTRLAEAYGIEEENLMVARAGYSWNFSRVDLKTEHFTLAHKNKNELAQSPWFLTMDGNLFFIKDRSEQIRELTTEERIKYTKSSASNISYTSSYSTTTYKYERPKEKSVRINVKKRTAKTEEEKKDDENSDEEEPFTEATEVGTEVATESHSEATETHDVGV